MEIFKIYLEEQLLMKYYVINRLILPNIQYIMDLREIMWNQELAEELHKPIIAKFAK